MLDQAVEAVKWLRQQKAVGMDSEGELERKGRICLVQLCGGGRAYVLDLHVMQPAVCADVLGLLGEQLLGDAGVVKVLHDCRKDCEALFYLHGVRLRNVWDTQVAHGMVQMLQAVAGGAAAADAGGGLVGLNPLLEACGLPINSLKKEMHRRMGKEADLWTRRPLQPQVVSYAVADVTGLVELRERMVAQLGAAGSDTVAHLSKAYAEWYFDDGDRSYASQPGSYASAMKPPRGCDMQMHIDAANSYRPRFSVALNPPEPEEDLPSAASPAEPCQAAASCAAAGGTAAGASGSLHVPRAEAHADDGEEEDDGADAVAILQLLPARIQAAIMRLCRGQGQLQEQQQGPAASGQGSLVPPPDRVAASSTSGGGGEDSSGGGGRTGAAGLGGSGVARRRPFEVVVDLGRPVAVRFNDGSEEDLSEELSIEEALHCLAEAKGKAGQEGKSGKGLFYSDNRAGVPGTLHRISAMRGRENEILGLTYRIGRHVSGVALLALDILAALSVGHPHADDTGKPDVGDFISPSLLLLGPPGVEKTTLLRDATNILADTFRKRVIVVDTSNEIAGDAPTPHACIGRARRMMVPDRSMQHSVMVEAVQNHMPQVVVVDEIGTSREAATAKSIAQRGVVMVGTAHGISLETLLKNPELNSLVGGVHQVVLGDEEARRTNAGSKTRTERCGAPTFSTLIEVLSCDRWRVHMNVARSVDAILAGREPVTQLRWYDGEGRMMVRVEGAPEGAPDTSFAKKALAAARGPAGERDAWLHDLINLAAMY